MVGSHRLLRKQIERATDSLGALDIEKLLDLVSAAYEEAERDRDRTNRSIELLAEELSANNDALLSEVSERTRERDLLRERFVSALDNVDQGILLIDDTSSITVCNRRAAELLDVPMDLLMALKSFEALGAYLEARGEFQRMDDGFVRDVLRRPHRETPSCFIRQRPNGRFLEVRTRRLPGGGGIRTYLDVTDRETKARELARAEAEFRGLFENAVVGIYRSSPEGRQLRANPALVRLNGYDSEEEMLAAVNDIAAEWYVDPARRETFKRLLEEQGKVTDFVSEIYRHKTRDRMWISETAWIVRNADGSVRFFEGMVIDATARMEAERRIGHMATHDSLTGLNNRAHFIEQLRKRLRRRKGNCCAVLCIDLDRFKDVNDTLGHSAGDTLLRIVARRLAGTVRSGDLIARLGGDEFAVLIPEVSPETALERAAEIVQSVSRPFSIHGQRAIIGASIGVAMGGAHGDNPVELLKNADIALYRAKSEGRERAALFDHGMKNALSRRRDVELALRQAIAKGEMYLAYQPIIDFDSGRVVSREALLRWVNPRLGSVSPGEFVPVAEDAGLMIGIGEWVIRRACAEIAGQPGHVRVAVNVSAIQLRSPQFVAMVVQALAGSGLSPDRLVIEITETVLLSDNPVTYAALRDLKRLGVKIALDDFGTGYSSLSYLQKFEFDKIKIDRSFVSQGPPSASSSAVVRAVINLGKDLDVDVVAEGVETEEQALRLRRAGCRLMQGYLFGRPVPLSPPRQTGPAVASGASAMPATAAASPSVSG
jgi:diguanylate cyclase (GGDEF)-like protein/PAS domain S-box-containing protein